MKNSPMIRRAITLFILFVSGNISIAQVQAQGLSEEQMQQMMQQAGAMQECFKNVDQSALQGLEAKGRKMESEIEALCAAGKRDAAMRAAMQYSQEIQSDPQLQEMRKCSELMQGMAANMPIPYAPTIPDVKDKDRHLCDQM